MLARLRHPNLILFLGYTTTPELCIISEYMGRGSLYGLLHSPAARSARAAAAAADTRRACAGEPCGGGGGAGSSGSSQPSTAAAVLPLALGDDESTQQAECLEPRLQRAVAVAVARGMAYLHTRNPPILHLVSSVRQDSTTPEEKGNLK